MPIQREMADELADLFRTHFRRVSRAVEIDEPFDPADVSVFGPRAVVFDANGFANLVEEPRLGLALGGTGVGSVHDRASLGLQEKGH